MGRAGVRVGGMGTFISRIIFTVFCTAIGRGVVAAFNLDQWVATMIEVAPQSSILSAVIWVGSGLFGVVCVLTWHLFHIGERIETVLGKPEKGSLVYRKFIPQINRSQSTGRTDITMKLVLENKNNRLIYFNAAVTGDVNGKTPTPHEMVTDGNIPPNETINLIYTTITNVPIPSDVDLDTPYLHGRFSYSVAYSSLESMRGARMTRKRLEFWVGPIPYKDVGAQHEYHIDVYFREKEEK